MWTSYFKILLGCANPCGTDGCAHFDLVKSSYFPLYPSENELQAFIFAMPVTEMNHISKT